MRTRTAVWVVVFLALSPALFAADITGEWKGEYTTFDGAPGQSTFLVRQQGEELSGAVRSEAGDFQIQNGKVAGDEVSFSVSRKIGRREVSITYTGKVAGDEMKLQVNFAGAQRGMSIAAKKVAGQSSTPR